MSIRPGAVPAAPGTSVAFADRGSWVTSTAYVVGDVVTQSGQRYLAKTAHTSGTFATDLAAAKWVALDGSVASLSDLGTWTASTAYAVGDVVTYSNRRYITKTAHTSTSTFDATKFTATDTGAAPSYDPKTGLYNATETSLSKFRAALARARSSAGTPCRITCFGDSITAGQTASAPINTYSWPGRLLAQLASNSRFTPASRGAAWGADAGNASSTRDNRWTVGTGWGGDGSGPGGISNTAFNATAPAGTLDFTPEVNVDTFVVQYGRYSGGGTLTFQVDGGSTTTLSTNGATGTLTTTISAGSLGAHTLHIGGTGAMVIVHAAEAYDSTANPAGVLLARDGVPGATSSNFVVDYGYGGLTAMLGASAIRHDLVILMIGTNDTSGSVAVATYKANMATLIAAAQARNADVLLIVPTPSNSVGTIPKAQYVTALYQLADQYNVALLDIDRRWNYSWATNNAAPYLYFSDANHLTNKGYADVGAAVAQALMSVG